MRARRISKSSVWPPIAVAVAALPGVA